MAAQARKALSARARRKRRYRVLCVLASVVVFCTTYALILPAITLERDLICGQEEHSHGEGCYDGDEILICGLEEHIHAEDCYEGGAAGPPEETPVDPLPEEGPDEEGPPVPSGEPQSEEETAGTEPAPLESAYVYEDNAIIAEVILEEGSTVPEGALLSVRPILDTDADYDYEALVWEAEETAAREAASILFYDISFYTEDEEYIPVEDTATVSLRFKETVPAEAVEDVSVLHFQAEDELPVMLEEVDVERDENDALSMLTFQTEGFSVFAVMTAADSGVSAQADSASSFALTYGEYTITFKIQDASGNPIEGTYNDIAASGATRYIFGESQSGTGGSIKENLAPKIDGYSYVQATYEAGNATTNVYSVATTGYDNNSFTDAFRIYSSEPITSGQWYTRSGSAEIALIYTEDTDISGTYAIVNRKSGFNSGVAMLADNQGDTDNTNRAGKTVSVVQSEGKYYVTDSTVTLWTFEKQSNGSYHISAEVNGATKYLTIGSADSSPVTLSDTPQNIIVTMGSGDYEGMFRLTNESGIAVNLFGGSASQGFGSYSDSSANEWQTLCGTTGTGSFLLYDLNISLDHVGSHAIGNGSWERSPELMSADGEEAQDTAQTIGPEAVLLYGPGEPGESGCFSYINTVRLEIRQKLGNAGKEFRFEGWAAEAGGETYLFPKGASARLGNDGKIYIMDVDGTERSLEAGSTLTAQWTEVSDIVMFFVNYTGTILDTEGNISGRNQKDFTGIVGIGRVYYGKQQAGHDNIFGNDANEQIRMKFVNAFDPDDPETQVVMEYVTVYDENVTQNSTAQDPQKSGSGYELYQNAVGINDTELETALLHFIQQNANVSIKVSAADNKNNPQIENENATTDNYSVRWYVMKEQSDGWHIDGVLVAKTAEITVTKTFSGLTDAQVKGILGSGTDSDYQMPVQLGKELQDYITMHPVNTAESAGQYHYYGQEQNAEGSAGQSYAWVLNAITDEQYTLSEENYTLNGYDVSTIAVNYFKDENGRTQVAYGYEPTTGELTTESGEVREVIGGETMAVSFNNFYTPTGTGAFAITKRAAGTGSGDTGGVLQGAEFTLTGPEGDGSKTTTAVSNSRGSAYFSGLEPGTYILQETKAPEGYAASSQTWTVEVENVNGKVTVTLYGNDGNGARTGVGTVCYDGGVKQSYVVENEPASSTIRVTKNFSGLSAVEMERLVQNSVDTNTSGTPYYIWLQGNIGAGGTIDGEGSTRAKLYLHDASRGQDGFTFTWMVTNLAVADADGKSISYRISENNYLIDGYMDTVITASVNDKDQILDVNRDLKCADFQTTFHTDQSDQIELTNHYTNTFTLTLQKMDSLTREPLANAVFDVYGPFREATDSSKRITYKDEDGRTRTAYYIDTITADESGIAVKDDLNLSSTDSNTFVYVINESFSPEGYASLDEPIAQTVTVTTDGYFNGVYMADVPNVKEENFVHRTLDTVKEWNPSAPAGVEVTLELYQVSHYKRGTSLEETADAVKVAEAVLNGTADQETGDPDGAPSAYEAEPWVARWMNLPSANAEEYAETGEHYHYFVREIPSAGSYTVSYTCYDADGSTPDGAFQKLRTESGETVDGVLIADMDEAYTVSITNTVYFELPETGGQGTFPYVGGGALMMAFSLLYRHLLRRKRERRSAR